VVEDNDSPSKIAVIGVDGVIFGGYVGAGHFSPVDLIAHQLRRAREDTRVKAVILRINSPGGEVLAADEIARAIAEFQEKSGKPVVAAMEGLAASGGYYVAAPCRWIVANELTLTGSIGVIMRGYNYRGLLDKVGVRPMVFKSGRFKDMLSGTKSETETLPEETQMVDALIQETFERFKQVVAEGRERATKRNEGQGRKLAADWETYADGRVLSGRQAHEHGFVDELGSFKAAVARARTLANVASADLIRYQQPMGLSDLLPFLGQTASASVKLDLGFDLPRLEVGRLYFLFAPGAH
jgi:protease-4